MWISVPQMPALFTATSTCPLPAIGLSISTRRTCPLPFFNFRNASIAIEKDRLDDAQTIGDEAESAFRQAELNAIRATHLAVARSLLAQANAAKTEKFAPRTTTRATDLLERADSLLVADRYDTESAIELARLAEYESRHAMYIDSVARRLRDKETTAEDVILEWESAMLAVTEILRLEVDMSAGSDQARDLLIGQARDLLELRETVAAQNTQILGLEEEIRELDSRLGGAAADRDDA